ncbi:phosphoribosyltransferase family protein [Paraburkholderia caribensis]|uniref:phosphoribosyltransferase family protein n=1 Tax=Paraburkholderia caribensis TaxID=75105 RepID=UPI001CB16D76|nr:phosphoribosyltransferase family protein [Paraburkholderia caribensis]CAG9269778.1 Phosphoribosyl transferase-like protein [Paraburkholderia caribensis]
MSLSRVFEALHAPRHEHVANGMRAQAAALFERGELDMHQYTSIFGGHALHRLTRRDGVFRDMDSGADATALARIYSRAKYGSISDIRTLADQVIGHMSSELDRADSHWARLFGEAEANGDSIVLMTTGWRNVPSTANVLYDIVVARLNVRLAHRGLPTIINVKLPRIAPPCENYASLSKEEREQVNLVQDHVIPAANFYRWPAVHVIFGDDVLITGSTADKVFAESMRNGAKSFQAIYPVAVDPSLALADAAIEERLNMVDVTGRLDDTLAALLREPDYTPILRTLRLVFSSENRSAFADFLPRVPAPCWMSLYVAALGNEFLRQDDCSPSLSMLRAWLTEVGYLSPDGGLTR